jgi:hypothetical protein
MPAERVAMRQVREILRLSLCSEVPGPRNRPASGTRPLNR